MSKARLLISLLLIAVIFGGLLWLRRVKPSEAKRPTIAIFNLLSYPILDASIKGIKAGLAERGYTEDKIYIREINANGEMDKLDSFARELLSLRPAVIVPVSTPVAQAVIKTAPPTQNIVFSTVTNPNDVGMSSRPKNVTGVSDAVNYEKNIDLIVRLFPNTHTIGIVYNPGERNSEFGMSEVRRLAKLHNLILRVVPVANGGEVQDAARNLIGDVDVMYVGSDNTVVGALPALLKVAEEEKKPVIASDSGSVEQGALAAVSVDYEKLGRNAGNLIADVLSSSKSAGSFKNIIFLGDSLVLNRVVAKKLGYAFPADVLQNASKVIDK